MRFQPNVAGFIYDGFVSFFSCAFEHKSEYCGQNAKVVLKYILQDDELLLKDHFKIIFPLVIVNLLKNKVTFLLHIVPLC